MTRCMAWQIEYFLSCIFLWASASHSSVHLPSVSLLGTASSHHIPLWCANSQWKTEKVSLCGSATGTVCNDCTYMLLCCFHVFPSYSCCFCSSSSYLSTLITPALKHSDRIACMRCLNCASVNTLCIAAHNHVHVSKKFFTASQPIKGLK